MPLILSGNVATATAATSFSVDNSCRFDGASAKLSKSLGAPSDADKFTWSFWIKRGNLELQDDNYRTVIRCYSSSTYYTSCTFEANDKLSFGNRLGAGAGGHKGRLITNREFRDCSSWYHFVCVWDSGNASAGDRMKMYVNGVEETSFSTDTNPVSDEDSGNKDGNTLDVGTHGDGYWWDGYMAEVYFCDGQAYGPTDFGEFDSDSPKIWKPKDASGDLTFGNNGFYLDFKDSANLGNDANGGTDLDETGIAAVDQATDTPTNNFATLNPLALVVTGPGTFGEGACKITGTGNDACYASTLGVKSGKWYFETQPTAGCRVGALTENCVQATLYSRGGLQDVMGAGTQYRGCAYASNGKGYPGNGGGTNASYGATYTDGDIIGVLLNLDDGEITFEKNDADQGALVTDLSDYQKTEFWFLAVQAPAADDIVLCNFGGCSAFTVSSGNADANGYGNFEYAVPSGYYALCTKNIAEFGG